ncbi:MAG: LOG family protein [Leptospiraceae bacterium]|nr:LOG family protein [Leptospiraceae bacterium]MCB1200516.1 LOG family protein [Leptospiraceae bacterium]
MTSKEARPLRILSEYLQPATEFRNYEVKNTIVFFGSARIRSPAETKRILREAKNKPLTRLEKKQHENLKKTARYYRECKQLAFRMTRWSKSLPKGYAKFLVTTGGGPGIMEAANRGASLAKGLSIGLNIKLPHEQQPNQWITPHLSLDFNYFFMRKYWLMHPARALVIFPGGFGTMDELFELFTLRQTGKMDKPVPIVIYGTQYWKELLRFEVFTEWGMINEEDLDMMHFSDDVEDAYQFLTESLSKLHSLPVVEENK